MPAASRCFFISMTWADGAVPYHFRALSEELVRRGHRVLLIVDHQRVDVVNADSNPAIFTWPSPRPTRWADARFLASLIRQYRPDCMFSMFGSTSMMMWVGWWLGVRCRVAGYFTVSQALQYDFGNKSTAARAKLALLRKRRKVTFSLATHIIPLSQAGNQDLQRVYGVAPKKCHVMYLSLPDPSYDIARPEDRASNPLCVARLDPSKGQDVVIRAVALLKARLQNAAVDFVGDGPELQSLQQLAESLGVADRCRFLGRVSHDEVLHRMADSPFTINAVRSLCFALVNIESFAVGTPVIASDVEGTGDTMDDGEEGFLIPPDDPETMADRFERLFTDVELRRGMSVKARQRYMEFEPTAIVPQQAQWLEQIVDLENV